LALAKGIDALALSVHDPAVFYKKMESACFLVFLGMVFDGLDGFVARLTRAPTAFGAQLDSFSDALTFGVVPAMLVKVLVEYEGRQSGEIGDARLHFLAAASFSLMAILRLVRFNLETATEDDHQTFHGLPSPAAAGAVASTIWLYLILRRPELEQVEGTPTPMHRLLHWMKDIEWGPILDWVPTVLITMLPLLGLAMVSRMRYVHVVQFLTGGRAQFFTLVAVVFTLFLFFLAPVPLLFLVFNGFCLFGLLVPLVRRTRQAATAASAMREP
jgi:CDP-diacylglycerol--serine O-phosphatidyltransferase